LTAIFASKISLSELVGSQIKLNCIWADKNTVTAN